MSKIKLSSVFILVIVMFATSCGFEKEDEPVSDTVYDLLDTVCSISIYGMPKDEAEKIISDAFALCRDHENILSKTVKGSDVYKINEAGGNEVEVMGNTYELLQKSIHYGELSEGKFDVSVGNLTALWNFQAETPKVPGKEQIDEALKSINYKNIELREENGKYFVKLLDDQIQLDLGGIAKGYIADKVSKYIEEQGVEHALINLGGNVVALGGKVNGAPWKIGIEKPFTDRKDVVGYVQVKDATVVTSGVYERYFEENGVMYHHIVDPFTGYPVDSDVESVSIVTSKNHSVDADALSSICLLSGSEKAIELIEGLDGFEAAVILKNGEIITTKNMNLKELS